MGLMGPISPTNRASGARGKRTAKVRRGRAPASEGSCPVREWNATVIGGRTDASNDGAAQ